MAFTSACGTGSAARTAGWAASRTRIAALSATAALLGGAAAPQGQVDLTVEGLRSAKGVLLVCLTEQADHFPDCTGDPAARHAVAPADRPVLRFADLASGSYAIALIHDENGNGRLDTRLGLPVEGVAFSRNPRLMFGPPHFAAARFAVGDAPVAEAVRMRYFL